MLPLFATSLALALLTSLVPAALANDADTVAMATRPAGAAAPTPAEIGVLRERLGRHVARVRVGAESYDVRDARFDAGGLTFAPGDARPLDRWESRGRTGVLVTPGPLSSPVGWDRIEGVTVRKPCGWRGALVGGVVGAAAYGTIVALVDDSNSEGMEVLVLLPLPAVTALLGAGLGSLVHRSEPGWVRGGGPAPPRAGAAAPAVVAPGPARPESLFVAGVPPPAFGILGADIARHPVRFWLGPRGYEARAVRLEAGGLSFDTETLRDISRRAAGDAQGTLASPGSPVAWERIDRIESRRPSGRRGAAWGMVVLPAAAVLVELTTRDVSGKALGGAAMVCVPIGALVGAGVGSLVPHSEREWDRSEPGSSARR